MSALEGTFLSHRMAQLFGRPLPSCYLHPLKSNASTQHHAAIAGHQDCQWKISLAKPPWKVTGEIHGPQKIRLLEQQCASALNRKKNNTDLDGECKQFVKKNTA